MDANHERIWLENPNQPFGHDGRQWCQDKVWPQFDGDLEPVEYIRADIAAAHTRAAVEAERAACETVAREHAHTDWIAALTADKVSEPGPRRAAVYSAASCSAIADAIAARKAQP